MGKRKTHPLIIHIKGQPIELWLVPFFSDFGFKAAWVRSKLFRRKAIEVLLDLKEAISSELTLIRNEITPLTRAARGGIYDVICREGRKQSFLIEMQRDALALFKKRVQFYLFGEYFAFVPKEDKEQLSFQNLPKIYSICIVKGKLLKGENYHNAFLFRNEAGEAFDSDVQLHVFELGKFPIKRNQANQVSTNLEKLLYTMKYAHEIKPEERPSFMEEDWLSEAVQQLDLGSLDAQQRLFLEYEWAKEADIRESQEIFKAEAYKEGREEGWEDGMKEGKKEGMKEGWASHSEEVVLRLHKDGFVNDLIAKYAVVSVEDVEKILAKHGKKPNFPASNGNGSNGKPTNGKK